MGWWESFVVTVTLLTVFARLRLRRSGRGAHNYRRYSLSSQPTAARPTLHEPDLTDTSRIFHVSYCSHCGSRDAIPLVETALERRPWRVTWRCHLCHNLSEASVPASALSELTKFDRVGGMRISAREYQKFKDSMEDLEEFVAEEL